MWLVVAQDDATLYIGHHWDEISFVAGRVAYLLTEADEAGVGCVRDIPVLRVDHFRDSPPTLDAFQAVYGPGCEIVPVDKTPSGVIRSSLASASSLVACLPPARDMRADQIMRNGPYRFPREAASMSGDGHTSKRAWIYKGRKFFAHANLETRS